MGKCRLTPFLPREMSPDTVLLKDAGRGVDIQRVRVDDDRGFVLLCGFLILLLTAGFMALVADTANLQAARLRVQTAADAAAVSAFYQLRAGNTGGMLVAAKRDGGRNGVRESDGAVYTVNCPPQTGAFAEDTGAVEITVAYPSPALLMRMFGAKDVVVTGRAVATSGLNGRPTLGE